VGFGRIARAVARRASGFDLRVVAHDPFVPGEAMRAAGVEAVAFDELLTTSDFVSLHAPLTGATEHLLGNREFALMKPRAILINTARGKLIDESALARALVAGGLGGAGLDVLETQPPAPDHPLLQLPNVVITPRIAGYSDIFYRQFWGHSVRALLAMARDRRPPWCANAPSNPRWTPLVRIGPLG
jgi:phosphoglycerate dehydrogenase-like enzyme